MPQILTVSPPGGSKLGGVEVTVTGFHLKYWSSITFGGCEATPVSANGAQAVFKTCALDFATRNVEVCFDGACTGSGFNTDNPNTVSFSLNSASADGLVSGFFTNQLVGNGSYDVIAEFDGAEISCGPMAVVNGYGNFDCNFGSLSAGSVSAAFGLEGSGLESAISTDVTPVISASSPAEGSLHGGATVTLTGDAFDEFSVVFVTVDGVQICAPCSSTLENDAIVFVMPDSGQTGGPLVAEIEVINGMASSGSFNFNLLGALTPKPRVPHFYFQRYCFSFEARFNI